MSVSNNHQNHTDQELEKAMKPNSKNSCQKNHHPDAHYLSVFWVIMCTITFLSAIAFIIVKSLH